MYSLTHKTIDNIIKLGNEHTPIYRISNTLGIDVRTVKKYLSNHNIELSYSIRKLSDEDIDLILKYHYDNKSVRYIAQHTGITQATISKYLKSMELTPNRNNSLIIKNTRGLCTTCDTWKSLDRFQKGKFGRLTYCKDCRKDLRNNHINNNFNSFLKLKAKKSRAQAKRKGIVFNITYKDLQEVYDDQEGKCFYTDAVLDTKYGEGLKSNTLSIDRIIPGLGYTKHNIVLCTYQANTCKSDITLKQMKEWMPGWYDRVISFINKRDIK